MAYLVQYQIKDCSVGACYAAAAVELFRYGNESLGFYCHRHGDLALTAQDASEARRFAKKGNA